MFNADNTQPSAAYYYIPAVDSSSKKDQHNEKSHLPLLKLTPSPVPTGPKSLPNNNSTGSFSHSEEASISLATTSIAVNSLSGTSSEFAIPENAQGSAQTSAGLHFQVYDLPAHDYNCGLFGIYGCSNITREAVVQQLLEQSSNPHIRSLMAHDILSLVIGRYPLSPKLQKRQEPLFKHIVKQYEKNNGSSESVQDILETLQEEENFKDYVRYHIGERLGSTPNSPYPMLTYEREAAQGLGSTGAMAAIAALTSVSLDIYHKLRQADGSTRLKLVFAYRDPAANAPLVSLLHMSQDCQNPDNLNHFQLLVPAAPKVIEVDVSLVDKEGNTALINAAAAGQLKEVEALLKDSSIDINAVNKYKKTALIRAATKGHIEVVKALLREKGVDVNAMDIFGRTALMWAVSNGHIEVVKALLKAPRLDVNAVNTQRKNVGTNTALMLGVKENRVEIVKALLEVVGINIGIANKEGKTALQVAQENNYVEIVKAISNKENKVKEAKKVLEAELMYAASNRQVEVVKALLTVPNIDVNVVDYNGWTPLMIAVRNEYTEIVKLLLAASGMDVNTVNKNGQTALMAAVLLRNTEPLNALLTASDIHANASDKNGWTALMHASKNGHIYAVRVLLDFPGIDVNARNSNQDTAHSLAKRSGHFRIVQAIEAITNH